MYLHRVEQAQLRIVHERSRRLLGSSTVRARGVCLQVAGRSERFQRNQKVDSQWGSCRRLTWCILILKRHALTLAESLPKREIAPIPEYHQLWKFVEHREEVTGPWSCSPPRERGPAWNFEDG